jgi:hypothetical protein
VNELKGDVFIARDCDLLATDSERFSRYRDMTAELIKLGRPRVAAIQDLYRDQNTFSGLVFSVATLPRREIKLDVIFEVEV